MCVAPVFPQVDFKKKKKRLKTDPNKHIEALRWL